jgi:hypothetical protein
MAVRGARYFSFVLLLSSLPVGFALAAGGGGAAGGGAAGVFTARHRKRINDHRRNN